MTKPRAIILGLAGPRLGKAERRFLRAADPWGFILFRRNVEEPAQVRALVEELRALVGRPDAPVLVDQEGGRVQRLGPPLWPAYPPGAAYLAAGRREAGEGAAGLMAARDLARLGARLIAHDLAALGVSVDCLPVLDVPVPGAHGIIGDRAYADEPGAVAVIGRAAAEGLIAGGVLPVVKHVPGHGRAGADSHESLPVVDASLAELEARDFAPFRALADMPLAMTAHVVFSAVDAKRPATLSRRVMRRVVRGLIGFEGLVMSDDLSMRALSGSFEERAAGAIRAGCDVLLHCNGDEAEAAAILEATPRLRGKALRRAGAALARVAHAPEPLDEAAARERLARALGA